MTAAAALARAEAAGVRLQLDRSGVVRMTASSPPPPEVLADLRRFREEVVDALIVQARVAFYLQAMAEALEALAAPDPDLDAERAICRLPG